MKINNFKNLKKYLINKSQDYNQGYQICPNLDDNDAIWAQFINENYQLIDFVYCDTLIMLPTDKGFTYQTIYTAIMNNETIFIKISGKNIDDVEDEFCLIEVSKD